MGYRSVHNLFVRCSSGWILVDSTGSRTAAEQEFRIALGESVDGLALVRTRVRQLLDGCDESTITDALLVVDSMVNNAYEHGGTPCAVRLARDASGACLWIEVDDTSPSEPQLCEPSTTGGFGLLIVSRLTASWGVQRYDHHKTVWAELELMPPGNVLRGG